MAACKEAFNQLTLPCSSPSPVSLGLALGNPSVSSHFCILDFVYLRSACFLKILACCCLFSPSPQASQPQRLRLAWPLPSWVSLAQSCHSPKTAMALGCFPKTSLKFKLLLSGGRVALFMMQFQSRIKVRRRHRLWSLVSVIIDLAHSHPPLWLHYGHLTGRGPFTKTAKLSIYSLYL